MVAAGYRSAFDLPPCNFCRSTEEGNNNQGQNTFSVCHIVIKESLCIHRSKQRYTKEKQCMCIPQALMNLRSIDHVFGAEEACGLTKRNINLINPLEESKTASLILQIGPNRTQSEPYIIRALQRERAIFGHQLILLLKGQGLISNG